MKHSPGDRVGHITLVRIAARATNKRISGAGGVLWECVCDCGKTFMRRAQAFTPSVMAASPMPACAASCSFKKAARAAAKPPKPRRKPVLDPDIAALPISRQAKHKRQRRRNGCCVRCGVAVQNGCQCAGCAAVKRERYLAKKGKS